MKPIIKFLPLLALSVVIWSCGSDSDVATKKTRLAELKDQVKTMSAEIKTLEAEIAKLDPEFAKASKKSILITTAASRKGEFNHYVEVTGSVVSRKNVNISAETGGRILEVPVTEGMRVSKGQILARIDSEIIERNIEEMQNSLDLATTIFQKQERLWKQQIGTEVQYLEAKNRKEGLEKSMASMKSQLGKSYVRAPFNGTLESIQVRVGELVQPGIPMFQFVGESDLYIQADVSESYIGALDKGDSVEVSFPSMGLSFVSKVSSIGAIINPNNRTFKVEVQLPNRSELKPNMISVLKIKDYSNKESVIVPSELILSDNNGDYIFIVEKNIAKKRYVKRGKSFGQDAEILDGLNGTEVLVNKGFREVGDNFSVTVAQL